MMRQAQDPEDNTLKIVSNSSNLRIADDGGDQNTKSLRPLETPMLLRLFHARSSVGSASAIF